MILPNWFNFDGVKYPNAPKIICCPVSAILLIGHLGTFAHSDPLGQSFGTPVAMQPHLAGNNLFLLH